MTDEEMQEAGLASEKKLVRLFVEGKMSLQEQDVWYQVANREAAKNYFRPS